MKYKVLHNFKDAVVKDVVGGRYANNVFDTFDEAVAYCYTWLGDTYWNPEYKWELNLSFPYNKHNDLVTIVLDTPLV